MKRLDPANPEAFTAWFEALRDAAYDALDTADDAAAPPQRRLLGPIQHRHLLAEARGKLDDLLEYAKPAPEPAPEAPSPNDTK